MYTASFEPNSKFNRIYILEIQIKSLGVAKFQPNLIYVWYLILLFGLDGTRTKSFQMELD